MKFIIALCDDEEMILKVNQIYIQELTKKINVEIEMKCFNNGRDLVTYCTTKRVDIAFLDIDMGDYNGMQTARDIKKQSKETIIIFVTGHSEFALDAFEVEAVGYLVKPIRPEKLEKVIRKAMNLILMRKKQIANTMLLITENNIKKKVPQFKIRYIEKEKNQCAIHIVDQTHYCYATISSIIEELEPYFIQVNQGTLINKNYIDKIEKTEVILKDGTSFVIGRKYMKKVREEFYVEEK